MAIIDNHQPRGFFAYFLYSYRVTYLIIVGLALLGVVALLTLPRESTPEVEIPYAIVITGYPGASARDVEELVTEKIETTLESLSGIKEITSSSSQGLSTIAIQYEASQDITDSLNRLREKVTKITGLPEEAQSPRIQEINFSNEPIITIALGGIDDQRLLTIYANELADRLERIAGISEVTIAGGLEEQTNLQIYPEKLAANGLSLLQVIGTIRSANAGIPLGQLETKDFNYDVRAGHRFANTADVAKIALRASNGTVIPLEQIADISSGITKTNTISRLNLPNQPTTSSVSLNVIKKTGGNIVDIVNQVKIELTNASQDLLPAGVFTETFIDRADEIRTSLSNVTRSGLQTLLIVLLILWLFLGLREALIAASSIPLTFFISFILFELFDISLNNISLFSLILSLGLLVDTTIVIVEGIHTGIGTDNLYIHAAHTVNRFKKPLIGGTLTTVAAFFPMLLVTGIIGEFLRTIPIVISSTLLAALFVSLALIPPIAVRAFHQTTRHTGYITKRFNIFFDHFRSWFELLLHRLLHNQRAQNIFIFGLTILLIAGLSLPFSGLLKTGLFPVVDLDYLIINVELPPGSSLSATSEIVKSVEEQLHQIPEITSYTVNIGTGSSQSFESVAGSNSNLASFFINLSHDRSISSIDISENLRQSFSIITQAKISVAEISAGPPTAPPVEINVSGPDLVILDELSRQVMDHLEVIPGTIDISRNFQYNSGEFTFTYNPTAVAAYGLNSTDISNTIRTYLFGSDVTTYLNQAGERTAVNITAADITVNSISKLLTLPILTPTGNSITLSQIASVELDTGVDTIRHRNGERTITITANASSNITPNEISNRLSTHINSLSIPNGYNIVIGGEQQETEQTFADLYRSMIIAVILILIILVVEFNSFKQPFIIFISIPMALIGVLFGLLIFRGQLNFSAFIGLVSLTGIVVNNAIILVDRMNILVAQGQQLIEAIEKSVHSRLRPVILTTFTTAAGVAPLIFVDEFFRDLALTIINGLIFSTILTLIFIPILYLRFEKSSVSANKPSLI